jgi:hypothetical protein
MDEMPLFDRNVELAKLPEKTMCQWYHMSYEEWFYTMEECCWTGCCDCKRCISYMR